MRLPMVHGGVVDAIIAALRTGGYLATDASANAIRSVSAQMDEAAITALANSLTYGAGGTGTLASAQDMLILIDSDALPSPWNNNKNYIRFGRAQESGPVGYTKALGSICAVAGQTISDFNIGPDTQLMREPNQAYFVQGVHYDARLFFGTYAPTNNTPEIQGVVMAGTTQASSLGAALRLHSPHTVELSSANVNNPVKFTYHAAKYRSGNDTRGDWIPIPNIPGSLGGFYGSGGDGFSFYVGEQYVGFGGTDSLLIRKKSYGYDIVNNNNIGATTPPTRLNISSSNTDYLGIVSVNGSDGADLRNPTYQFNPALGVFGKKDVAPVFVAVGIEVDYNDINSSKVALFRSYDVTGGVVDKYWLISAERHAGGPLSVFDPVFKVSNIGNVYADGTYTSPAADVAEWVEVDTEYEPGTVLSIGPDGIFTASAEENSTLLAGVVATKPGIAFGRGVDEVDPPAGKVPMTICGFTPVKCTTSAGNIQPGDMLVSSTNGHAQKAAATPAVGTILGKAMGSLVQDGDDPAVGLVKTLVILQ